ncbi:hypothetical protein GWL_09260 [Herbaspirillum sp. GW103]|nr:hypothetical protein GWL_09260 [Herbaspirillum sp. GW103]
MWANRRKDCIAKPVGPDRDTDPSLQRYPSLIVDLFMYNTAYIFYHLCRVTRNYHR